MTDIIPIDNIQSKILTIRNQKVMIDSDLAELYQVKTKVLNQAVKRNINRFPQDFMFQLTQQEKDEVVTNCDHLQKLKFSYIFPSAFTELGVSMLSSILNSEIAINVNIKIMRAFVNIRKSILNSDNLNLILKSLNDRVDKHDAQIKNIIDAVNFLIAENSKPKPAVEKPKKPMGFKVNNS